MVSGARLTQNERFKEKRKNLPEEEKEKLRKRRRELYRKNKEKTKNKCVDCGRLISKKATRCPYCNIEKIKSKKQKI